jgi:hypothetical protein
MISSITSYIYKKEIIVYVTKESFSYSKRGRAEPRPIAKGKQKSTPPQ